MNHDAFSRKGLQNDGLRGETNCCKRLPVRVGGRVLGRMGRWPEWGLPLVTSFGVIVWGHPLGSPFGDSLGAHPFGYALGTSFGNILSWHGESIPGHGESTPGHGESTPGLGRSMPGHGFAMPGHGDPMPGHDKSMPGLGFPCPGGEMAPISQKHCKFNYIPLNQ